MFKDLRQSDLVSVAKFKTWVENNIPNQKEVDNEKVLIIIAYIRDVVLKSDEDDKYSWIKMLNNLIKVIEAEKNVS